MKHLYTYISALLLLISAPAFAQGKDVLAVELLNIQQQWAHVNYELKGDQQEKQFAQLIERAQQFTSSYPDRAESWIWYGIVQSSYAGAKGGLGALSLAKAAKISLEKALQIDATALSGSAYTSLGTLYHQVPGWPIGFGDDDMARELLEKALSINPNGIDPNYFYGAFLYDDGYYRQAQQALIKAQQAPKRAQRPLADEGRKKEIAQLLAKVDKKIK